jgi:predicted DNA-binding transcriptional regulator YafY
MTRRVETTAEIKRMLEMDGRVSLQDIMEAFDVVERTARRYIADMRELFDLEHDEGCGTYRLKGVKEGALPKWADKRLFPLLLQFLSRTKPPLVEGVEEAFKRAAKGEGSDTVVFDLPEAVGSTALPGNLKILNEAARNCERLSMTYHKPGSAPAESCREFDPYVLVYTELGDWWAIGWCHKAKKVRTFAVDRIVHLEPTGYFFHRDDGFDLDKFQERSFRMYDEGKAEEWVIRFDPSVAEIIKSRLWHPRQKSRDLPDGSVEISFVTTGGVGVKRWLFRWIPLFSVVEPETRRDEIAEELAAAAAKQKPKKAKGR